MRRGLSGSDFREEHFKGSSPWGGIQSSSVLARGVRSVSTASHGGFMVTMRWARMHLSDAAINAGFWYGSYLCYEEDCDWAILCYEDAELLEAYRAVLLNPDILTKEHCLHVIQRYCKKYCEATGIEYLPPVYPS